MTRLGDDHEAASEKSSWRICRLLRSNSQRAWASYEDETTAVNYQLKTETKCEKTEGVQMQLIFV